MDDDAFEDAAELVGVLGKMMKRGAAGAAGVAVGGGDGLGGGRGVALSSRGSTPRGSQGTRESTPRAGIPERAEGAPPVPGVGVGIAIGNVI